MNRRINLLCCLVLLLIVGLTFLGCNNSILEYRDYTIQNSINPEYKTLTVTEGIAHFYCDYPANGMVPSVQTGDSATIVIFDGQYASMRILVMIDNGNRPSYRDRLPRDENGTAYYQTILEGKPAITNGNQGWQTKYTYKYKDSPAPSYCTARFFDHNGMVWEIKVDSTNKEPGIEVSEFEHLLDTFKILG